MPGPDWVFADAGIAALVGRCTFPPAGTAVTCAVSGGPDSTALAVLAVGAGLVVTIVHVDHALRPGSADEAEVVAGLASRLDVGFRAVRAPVHPGPNLEARARTARHRAVGADALFGHTTDDQAETVLLRLLRGTGPTGLAAMRADRHPLLALRRHDTVGLCDRLGLPVVVDPSNDSQVFTRNRIRHEVLPLLADVAGRDVAPLLARLAGLAAQQSDLLDEMASGIDPTDAAELNGAPEPVAVAALRRWWRESTAGSLPPDEPATRRVLEVASGDRVGTDVAGGWRVERTRGRLRLVPPATSSESSRRDDRSAPVPGPHEAM